MDPRTSSETYRSVASPNQRWRRARRICAVMLAACVVVSLAACSGSKSSASASTLDRLKKAGVVTVGYANEKPYDYQDGSNVTGSDPELLRAFFGQYGIKLKFVLVDFAGLIPGLQANRFDVVGAGMFILPARCKVATFANPDYQMIDAFAVAKGNPLNIHSWKDLAASKATFGTSAGGEEVQYATRVGVSASKVMQYPSYADAAAALAAGRVGAVAQLSIALRSTLDALNSPKVEYVEVSDPPLGADGKPSIGYGGPTFPKNETDLADTYNAWLAKARTDGTYQKVMAQFGFQPAEYPPATLTASQLCSSGQ